MINLQLVGLISVLLVTVIAGIWSASKVRTAQDFDVGNRTFDFSLIIGSLYGSFVGGTSLIGTSQLAFHFGMGAIWFTLGGAVGIALMGLLAQKVGTFHHETVPQLIEVNFGRQARLGTSIYMTLGMFIQIIAQVLAAMPLLVSLLPISSGQAALIAILLIFASVWTGGLWGTSLVGMFKTLLMTFAFIIIAYLAFQDFLSTNAWSTLPAFPWYSPFPRGVFTDLATGLAVCIGTMSTQTYWQPLFAARSPKEARLGALGSALLILFMGGIATAVGMVEHMIRPEIPAIAAMPSFIQHSFPAVISGIVLGGLLISVVITGSGLTLGVATVLSRDVYQNIVDPKCSEARLLMIARIIVSLTLLVVLFVAVSSLNSIILEWAFFSMALRGVAVLFPLLRSLLHWGPAPSQVSTYGILISPLAAICAGVFSNGRLDPLYTGLACYLIFWGVETWMAFDKKRLSENA